jgi:hypothetical protein
LVVLVAFECIAVPICIAAGDAFVTENYGRAIFGWSIGIPLAVAGFTAHWWKEWLNEPARAWVLRNANRWWPAAILLAFTYVTGPDIYRRAITQTPMVDLSPTETGAETQKATLIEWLQLAQRERDQKQYEVLSAQTNWAADRKQMEALRSQLVTETQARELAEVGRLYFRPN